MVTDIKLVSGMIDAKLEDIVRIAETLKLKPNATLLKSMQQAQSAVVSIDDLHALLIIVDDILIHYQANYCDEQGNPIKFSVWQLVINPAYRKKIVSTINFIKDTVQRIISLFKK
jgi:hypothetical protein